MKTVSVTILTLLFILNGTLIFSQTSQVPGDTSRQIEELSAKLAAAPVFFNYFTSFDRIAKAAIANMSVKSATEDWKRLYKEKRDKVYNDRTLNESEKSDSIQSIFFTSYEVPKAGVDTIASLTKAVYIAFPELSQFTRATASNIFDKAHKVIDAEKPINESSPNDGPLSTKVEHPPVFPGNQRSADNATGGRSHHECCRPYHTRCN